MSAQFDGDALWEASWVEGEGERTIKKRRESSGRDVLTFYSSWFCPFAQRGWIALEEKGVEYRYVEIDPYECDMSKPGGYTKKQLPLEAKQAKYPDFVSAARRSGPSVRVRAAGENLFP